MMIASAPASTRALACSMKASRTCVFGEIAVGLHQAAERADVADDVAVAAAEGFARDLDGGLVDLDDAGRALPCRLSMIREPPKVLVRMQSEPASA